MIDTWLSHHATMAEASGAAGPLSNEPLTPIYEFGLWYEKLIRCKFLGMPVGIMLLHSISFVLNWSCHAIKPGTEQAALRFNEGSP